jgi:hypothetical protein
MNEKDVAFFGTLLGIDAGEVKTLAEAGSLGDKIKALGLVSKDDVEKLKTNLRKEVREVHLSELVEQAKKGELDGDLYKAVKGASYEMLEKELAKEYNVQDFNGVKDLVAKAIKNNTAIPDDKKLQELTEKVERLQEANIKLVTEKDEAVQAAKQEYEGKILAREKTDFVSKLPFDFSDVEEKDLETVTATRRKILTDVFDARYQMEFKNDKILVKGRDGNPLMNEATYEPIPVSDVLKKIASELGLKLKSPESGGQGGKSSGGTSGKFASPEAYFKYCESKGLNPTSPEAMKIRAERGIEM